MQGTMQVLYAWFYRFFCRCVAGCVVCISEAFSFVFKSRICECVAWGAVFFTELNLFCFAEIGKKTTMKNNAINNKKFASLAVAILTISTLNTNAGVFDFETVSANTPITSTGTAVLENNGWGYTYDTNSWQMVPGTGFTSQTTSSNGIVGTLTAPGKNYGGFISNATDNSITGSSADTKAYDGKTQVGGGANGSSNFGVIMTFDMMGSWETGVPSPKDFVINGKTYNASYTEFSDVSAVSFLMGESLNLTSIDIALTMYTYRSMTGGDSFVASDKTLDNAGQFYAVRIYGVGQDNTLADSYVDVMLGENVDGVKYVQDGWETISLSTLNNGEAVNGLAFQVISNIADDYGLTVPAYIAIDNIRYESTTAVPEPAEWAVILGGVALALVVVRRKPR